MKEARRSALIFRDMREKPDEHYSAFCLPIVEEIRAICRLWGVLPWQTEDEIATAYRHRARQAWEQSQRGTRLRQVKSSCYPAFYLLHESKPHVCWRARLRQDVCNNAASRYKRGLCDSPVCTRCGHHLDDREHMLLNCPAFHRPRQDMRRQLLALATPIVLSLQLLLADESLFPPRPPKRLAALLSLQLSITGRFLWAINLEFPI